MSQDQLAEISGITKNSISEIERGIRQNVKLDTLEILAKSLGSTVAHLIGEDLPEITDDELEGMVKERLNELRALREQRERIRPISQESAEERDLLVGFRRMNRMWQLFWLALISGDQKYRKLLKELNPSPVVEQLVQNILDLSDRK